MSSASPRRTSSGPTCGIGATVSGLQPHPWSLLLLYMTPPTCEAASLEPGTGFPPRQPSPLHVDEMEKAALTAAGNSRLGAVYSPPPRRTGQTEVQLWPTRAGVSIHPLKQCSHTSQQCRIYWLATDSPPLYPMSGSTAFSRILG